MAVLIFGLELSGQHRDLSNVGSEGLWHRDGPGNDWNVVLGERRDVEVDRAADERLLQGVGHTFAPERTLAAWLLEIGRRSCWSNPSSAVGGELMGSSHL